MMAGGACFQEGMICACVQTSMYHNKSMIFCRCWELVFSVLFCRAIGGLKWG